MQDDESGRCKACSLSAVGTTVARTLGTGTQHCSEELTHAAPNKPEELCVIPLKIPQAPSSPQSAVSVTFCASHSLERSLSARLQASETLIRIR